MGAWWPLAAPLLGFEVGFLPLSIWDAVDIAIVSYLLFQLYKLVRGSIAFNIFIGVVTVYALWFIVGLLGMDMLRAVLGQFVSVGVIIIIIIFQPEIRRFLVVLGDTTLRQRSNVLQRLLSFGKEIGSELSQLRQRELLELKKAILTMSASRTGALIVLTRNARNEPIGPSGTRLNAEVSDELVRTIFDKHTPLHDGAMLIENGKIFAAGCVLPVTDRADLPSSVGLRHRAAVGLTERSDSVAFVVSEETGTISVANGGKLLRRLSESKLEEALRAAYVE